MVYVDIKATSHMSHDVDYAFTNYQTCEEGQVVYLGDNNTQKIHVQGDC